ncbi:MAG: glycerol-3-phosphate dehydrogenase/oxidase, partial [Flavobacteriales bacterium]
ATEQGATLINYMRVINLIKDGEQVVGIEAEDALTLERFRLKGKVVINATGVFVDEILKMNNPAAKKMVRPSQGVHIVLDKSFLNTNSALMIPKTADGRVLFAVPWHDHLLVGTTDTPLNEHSLEPRALKEETDFILATAASYFTRKPTETDILSVFSGLRPLAAPTDSNGSSTKEISRDHKLIVSAKGLITITGGKWTTYRKMAEETIDLAIKHSGLPFQPCVTKDLKIHGCAKSEGENYMNIYGTDSTLIEELCKLQPGLNKKLHPNFPYTEAEVVWAIRNEMAETVEDILSRRLRVLFIDATAAIEMSEKVASLLATELGADKNWEENQIKIFNTLASGYIYHQKKKEREPILTN